MNFERMKCKIIKTLKRMHPIYTYEYKTFDIFAKLFHVDLYLSGSERLVVSDFPRYVPFVITFRDSINFGNYNLIKERAMQLLRKKIGYLIITENNTASLDAAVYPAMVARASLFLIEMKGNNCAFSVIEKMLSERLALPQAKDL